MYVKYRVKRSTCEWDRQINSQLSAIHNFFFLVINE